MKILTTISFVVCGGILFAKNPKNIVLIMADDIGIECFGSYGGTSYKTPNIDRLASTGLRFTHAYSQPLCTPTRLEIMTGRENHRNWMCFGIMPPKEKTFGHMMQGFGYKTCMAGKWQLQSYDPPDFPNADERRGKGMHPKDAGFDSYALFHSLHTEDKGSRYADPTYLSDGELHKELKGQYGEDLSVDFLLKFMGKNRDKKMFLYYPMALPHWPMNPTPSSEAWKDSSRRLEADEKYFPDMVEYMDTIVGRLVDGVEKLGLRDDTLILFYSDNGTDQRIHSRFMGKKVQGGKNRTSQTGIRVPLIANWPNGIESGLNSDLVESSDFLPTLAALAGKKVPSDWQIDGMSFEPQLFGDKGPVRDWAFFWYDPRPGWDKEKFSRSIFALDHDYKLFSDGRMYEISGVDLKEEQLDLSKLTPEAEAARRKLKGAIAKMMKGPISAAAQIEFDSYGRPVKK
ncbi:MAG: sulfatase-like hydrolase/transferase [Akkermansiaceae bacterium]|nr:sulfatase-like hydrolase/transferase [Akkermansiaceae bacterium]